MSKTIRTNSDLPRPKKSRKYLKRKEKKQTRRMLDDPDFEQFSEHLGEIE